MDVAVTGEVYRTPDERFQGLQGYPFEPHYADLDGLRMHFVDEGPASGDPVLLLHGEPTWSYLYRKVIPVLAGHPDTRVLAPDYFGFGRSDKPTHRGFYSYDRHVWSMAELVKVLDLSRLTIVVQDWGGPIGLRLAVEDPGRVARLVVLNTGLFVPNPERPPGEGFMRWRNFAERAGLELPIGFVIQSATASEPSAEVLRGYEAPFPVPESKTGAATFPLLVPLSPADPGAAEMLRTREALGSWDKPALVYFGDSDPVFRPHAARAMAAMIPTAGEPEFLEGAAHFLQEDRGEEIARRVVRFLDETV
jgi:haloalkane dehalogenase